MALRLEVVSDHRRQLGELSRVVFGTGGGSIGRARDNDWVLPDPHRYLSARHARVHFRQGAYYLEDLSTNGVYVNGGEAPVSRTGAHALTSGDKLRIGDYHVAVTIEADETTSQSRSGISYSSVMPARGMTRATDHDLGAALSFEELIQPDPLSAGLAIRATSAATERPDPMEALRAVPRRRAQDAQSAVHAFCRGVGIDPASLPMDSAPRLLLLAGRLLREMLLGLGELESVQAEFRGLHRIEPPRDIEERVKASGTTVDALAARLLAGHERNELDAVMWMRESLRAIRHHELAASQAMRAALTEFLQRLEPSAGGAHAELHRSLTQAAPGQLPHLFVEALAQAYAEEWRARFDASK